MNAEESHRLLIALDLDGTAVRYEPRLEMDPDLMEYISSLRERGAAWAMNSDRYTDTMIDIAMLLPEEQRPAAILSCQRFIHLLNSQGRYAPVSPWNSQQMLLHKSLWDRIAPHFAQWHEAIAREFTIVAHAINDLVCAYLVSTDQTPPLRARMRALVQPWPDAQVSGNQEWTFILHAAFSKGRVLGTCAELLGVDPQNIIAVGDGLNDITMLNGSVTRMVGCPGNASPEVVQAVTEAGGVVAEGTAAAGTLHILRHYLEGCSGGWRAATG
jgi:hydroxymethylpyrimidine pyrophosphatase-like HAD family hydrolase